MGGDCREGDNGRAANHRVRQDGTGIYEPSTGRPDYAA